MIRSRPAARALPRSISSYPQHPSSFLEQCRLSYKPYMGSWVRTITTPFRKACTIFGPHKDGGGKKQTQQRPNSAAVVQHVDAERAKLHGEVMACAYDDVQVMWSMLDQARIRDLSASS
ncbi:hypothetical protein ZEAMMB73_Zm00001d008196 [Zea mays]|uniref:Uncharacterized protein n=3 Tax=Zea mays TaxID=4577 RepID=A0A1D6FAU9_MAIZE|nr:hypothetical protein ZEAMMB73_Zm00001d008196 [Zea mays]